MTRPANGPDPQSHKVRAENLGINLNDVRDLRLVVLTACACAQQPGGAARPTEVVERGSDSVAAHLLKNTTVGAVIAMQFDLESQAAEILSGAIYSGLLSGQRLDLVLNRAREESHRAWAVRRGPPGLGQPHTPVALSRRPGLPVHVRPRRDSPEGPRRAEARARRPEERTPRTDGTMRTSPPDVRTNLMVLLKELQQKLSETLNRQSELLGESLRLVPVSVQLGKPARCRVSRAPCATTWPSAG